MPIDTKKRRINVDGKVIPNVRKASVDLIEIESSDNEGESTSDHDHSDLSDSSSIEDRRVDRQGSSIFPDDTVSRSGSTSRVTNNLEAALRGCDASALVYALADSLKGRPAQTLRTLEAVLVPLIKANTAKKNTTKKHCVRCHKTYKESSNTLKSCVIQCTTPKETNIPDEEYDCEYKFRFPCCNTLVSHDEASGGDWEPDDDSICFTDKHTTDPTSVRYYGRRGERRMEDGLDHSGRNKNVQTCEAMRCGKKRSREDSE
ncbi:hypothetical protein FRC12_024349 [Ceratobasidium sp. 428]|nr:hypothetical protein FRC12_024349 [Ceratobasidium sp. 428]